VKILLVQPPFEDFYATPIRLYPLGLLYAARVLRAAGCSVEILDCLAPLRKCAVPVPEEMSYLEPYIGEPHFFKGFYRFGIRDEEILRRIMVAAPDLVGISSQFTAYYQSVESLARLIKKELGLRVFIGGHHATAFADEIRKRTPEIDHVLTGPAEDCLPRLLKGLRLSSDGTHLDWAEIRPAHDLLVPGRHKIGRKNYISITASRGCPFPCDFCCVHNMFGAHIRYRTAASVLDEMRWARLERGVEVFNFEDDNLSFDRDWFLAFLDAVAAHPALAGVELTAMNGFCSWTLHEEHLRAMAAAGFKRLNLSFVSRSPEVKSSYRRRPENSDFEDLIRVAHRLGLFVTVYVMIGLPGQTYEEVRESMEYLWGLGVLVGPSVFYVPPGSPLFSRLDLPAGLRDNWNLYRSSAFAVESAALPRSKLLELFLSARGRNLENRAKLG